MHRGQQMGYEDLALRLLSAQRFFHHFRQSLSAGRRKTPATSCCGALAVPSRLALDTATPPTRSLCEPIRTLIEMETVGRLRDAR